MSARVPRFLHVLTSIHAIGAIACFAMAFGSFVSKDFRTGLALSPGSALMVGFFGDHTWVFLLGVGAVLAALAYLSWRRRPGAWPLTLLVYGVGVVSGLWQVSVGIRQGWAAAIVNGCVVIYAARPGVRRAYVGRGEGR